MVQKVDFREREISVKVRAVVKCFVAKEEDCKFKLDCTNQFKPTDAPGTDYEESSRWCRSTCGFFPRKWKKKKEAAQVHLR